MEKNGNKALGEKWGKKETGEKENILLFKAIFRNKILTSTSKFATKKSLFTSFS